MKTGNWRMSRWSCIPQYTTRKAFAEGYQPVKPPLPLTCPRFVSSVLNELLLLFFLSSETNLFSSTFCSTVIIPDGGRYFKFLINSILMATFQQIQGTLSPAV